MKTPGGFRAIILLGAVLAALCALVAVLAPSDSLDWDTLAYHLAVPKMWIQDGQMHYVSFIHQSNFPLTVDGLYIWGLDWGGESGAKAFSLCFAIYGAIALFGFARDKYGEAAGWWSLLAYVAIPMVVWEAGTGYIDVSNGLFIGLGILFAASYAMDPADRRNLWLSAIFLGFGAGSKYTGLQTIGVVAVVLIVCSLWARRKQGTPVPSIKGTVLMAVVAFAICSPWYLRNVINTGNPVFPFFYSVFGGKNWDAFSDQIYKEQQQTFGAGRAMATPEKPYTSNGLDPTRIGDAILGLAYQPGRYADPSPTSGFGFPFVSLGAVGLGGLLAWLLSGRIGRFESLVAASVLVSLGGWFVLSEQSRYILGLIFPLCVLSGGAVAKLRVGPILAGAAAVQLLAGLFVLTRYQDEFSDKLRVVLGGQTREDYLKRHVGFYEPAQALNQIAQNGKVGLFDEVFGFYLDVPYFWASPGHSTQMGYEQMQSADEFVVALRNLGITHIYINLGQMFGQDKNLMLRWRQAAGLEGLPKPFEDRADRLKDPRDKYKVLLAEAIANHSLTPVNANGSRLIFAVPQIN
jgi:4-amino-4-deoxy-L-arabinose transferase-like glycosyltransferase